MNDVKGTLTLPISSSYTLDSFIDALQKQINQLQSTTGSSVSGVSVAYDSETNGLVFTTGTKGTDSFIKVSGVLLGGSPILRLVVVLRLLGLSPLNRLTT